MASVNFKSLTVNLGGLVADGNGKISTTSSTNFLTNVIDAGASIQSWKLSFSNHHDIKVFGVGIENIQHQGNELSFDIWMQLFDTANKIIPSDSELIVSVYANCE